MAATLPGFGLAPWALDAAGSWHRVAEQLRALGDERPEARLVRNGIGNLTIVEERRSGVVVMIGYVDVLLGDVVLTEHMDVIPPA